MKKLFWPRILPVVVLVAACVMACKDDDKPKLLPEMTTALITEITPTTAIGGGEITSDGNDQVTVSGICWSSTNTTPTNADSKSELTISEGSFTSKMENLPSGSTIYVRAYATNSVGTGYGEVKTFMTGNAAPIATNVAITGTTEVNKTITGSYTYADAEGNAESGTTMQWFRASDASGTSEIAIAGATSQSYVLQDPDEFKYLRFSVLPKASSGNKAGSEVKSNFVGPIAVRTTISFTYNNTQVTYGIITSTTTGRKWLDRNLGAPNTPEAYNDYANYGDLFQWGRAADGHQLITRASTNSETMAVNGTTTTLSAADQPFNSLFIIIPNYAVPRDWRSPQNDNLWQGSNVNNPCPNGWHIPSEIEWDAEKLDYSSLNGFSKLKLTFGGMRNWYLDDGEFYATGKSGTGYYWSSSLTPEKTAIKYTINEVSDGPYAKTDDWRATGASCRCIKDQ